MCERMVGMLKEGLNKVKGEEDISRRMMMMIWTVASENCWGMKIGVFTKTVGVWDKFYATLFNGRERS